MAGTTRAKTGTIKQGASMTWRQWVRRFAARPGRRGMSKMIGLSTASISPTEASWLAAWFEGEGSAGVYRIGEGFKPIIQFGQKTLEPLDWIQTKFPCTISKVRSIHGGHHHMSINRQKDILRFVRRVRPYIKSPRKLVQLEEVEEFCLKMEQARRRKIRATAG